MIFNLLVLLVSLVFVRGMVLSVYFSSCRLFVVLRGLASFLCIRFGILIGILCGCLCFVCKYVFFVLVFPFICLFFDGLLGLCRILSIWCVYLFLFFSLWARPVGRARFSGFFCLVVLCLFGSVF
jgi:hypothetical protein